MLTAINRFQQNLEYARDLGALYGILKEFQLPNDLSDLLRGSWVYAVSAFDKLNHDLVRIGMLAIFASARPPTASFENFTVSTATLINIQNSSVPPAAHWFEAEIIDRHNRKSFQRPQNVAEGLSLIWDEPHKWQAIADLMGMSDSDVRTTLTNIVVRRDQIVHEADFDPSVNARRPLTFPDTSNAIDFIKKLGTAIFDSVR